MDSLRHRIEIIVDHQPDVFWHTEQMIGRITHTIGLGHVGVRSRPKRTRFVNGRSKVVWVGSVGKHLETRIMEVCAPPCDGCVKANGVVCDELVLEQVSSLQR